MKVLGWVFLALYVAYRRTWGACDCDGLKRRLIVAKRETQSYQGEARVLREILLLAQGLEPVYGHTRDNDTVQPLHDTAPGSRSSGTQRNDVGAQPQDWAPWRVHRNPGD
jgi:hypothetical protein